MSELAVDVTDVAPVVMDCPMCGGDAERQEYALGVLWVTRHVGHGCRLCGCLPHAEEAGP